MIYCRLLCQGFALPLHRLHKKPQWWFSTGLPLQVERLKKRNLMVKQHFAQEPFDPSWDLCISTYLPIYLPIFSSIYLTTVSICLTILMSINIATIAAIEYYIITMILYMQLYPACYRSSRVSQLWSTMISLRTLVTFVSHQQTGKTTNPSEQRKECNLQALATEGRRRRTPKSQPTTRQWRPALDPNDQQLWWDPTDFPPTWINGTSSNVGLPAWRHRCKMVEGSQNLKHEMEKTTTSERTIGQVTM